MTSKTKCTIVILCNDKTVATFAAVTQQAGNAVRVMLDNSIGYPVIKSFKTTPRKPAMRAAFEAVMLYYKGYNPQTMRVTLKQPTDDVGPEGF